MSARVQFVVGDFALYPNRAEFRLKRPADLPGQFRDGENLRRLLEQIACELHRFKRPTLNAQRPAFNA
jgi:hypothetical protein